MSTLRRSSSSYGGFADGILIRGMPIATLYPGNIYWVDSAGGGGSKGTFNHPCLTIAAAHALVTTNNGDMILVKPGHAETITATVDFSKSGFSIIGLGFGANRPIITMSATTADDGWDFEGDNIVVYNIKFKDGDGASAALPCINCSGDNMHIEGCYFRVGADMNTCVTHDTTGKTGFHFISNTVFGYEAGPDVGVRFEKAHMNAVIEGNKWLFGKSIGCDTGCIVFVSGNGTTAGNHLIRNEFVAGLANSEPFIAQPAIQADSLCCDVRIIGDDATDNLGVSTAASFGFINCFVTQQGAGVPASAVSLGSASGCRPWSTTPAL
jgi:hypothetical protein